VNDEERERAMQIEIPKRDRYNEREEGERLE
jgi:hypothetical protein